MKRCVVCGRFFDGDRCPTDHGQVPDYTPTPQEYETDYGKLFTLGHAVTCQTEMGTLPGLLVGYDAESKLFRVLVALPGEKGHVFAISLPGEDLA